MPREIIRYGTRQGESLRSCVLDGPAVQPIKYSRATLSPGATYHVQPAPEPCKHVEARPPRQRYDNSSNMLGPEAIRQIVEALESLDWVVWVRERMKIEHGNNASIPAAEPPETPREHYVKTRLEAEQYHRVARGLKRDDKDAPEQYGMALDADRKYRESRACIAERIRQFAEQHGCDWDTARTRLAEPEPLDLLPAGVC